MTDTLETIIAEMQDARATESDSTIWGWAERLRALTAAPQPVSAGEGGAMDIDALRRMWRALVDAGGATTIARHGVERGSVEWATTVTYGMLAIERHLHPERFDDLTAAPQPAQTQGECLMCGGVGLIGGTSGQTPESYEEVTVACPDCTSQPAAAQGGEWVLVPSEPTPEMIEAAEIREDDEPLSDWGKIVPASHAEIYKAMLAAAPQLAQAQGWHVPTAGVVVSNGGVTWWDEVPEPGTSVYTRLLAAAPQPQECGECDGSGKQFGDGGSPFYLCETCGGTGRATPPAHGDGEVEAFEAWAVSQRYDMQTHPLHWLFLNQETYAARQGWKAGMAYALATRPAPTAEDAGVGRDAVALSVLAALGHKPKEDDRCRARVVHKHPMGRPPGPGNTPIFCYLKAGHEGQHRCNHGGMSPSFPFRESDEVEFGEPIQTCEKCRTAWPCADAKAAMSLPAQGREDV